MTGTNGIVLVMLASLVLYLVWNPNFHLFSGVLGKNQNGVAAPSTTTVPPNVGNKTGGGMALQPNDTNNNNRTE